MESIGKGWLTMAEVDPADPRIGGKARSLLELRARGFRVPPWLIVLPELCPPGETPSFPAEHATALADALTALVDAKVLWAVRSSARSEDGAEASFAGQFESFLQVPHEEVTTKIAEVWQSGFSERVRAYRQEKAQTGDLEVPGVIVQQMVQATWAGVAFSLDPVNRERNTVVVSAVEGLGESLVSGAQSGVTWRLRPDGTPLDAPEHPPLFPESLLKGLAEASTQIERIWQRGVDIEWAWAEGELFLLQARPITGLGNVVEDRGDLILWDNSNIAESYNGVTSPLTFSFARSVYREVYQQFCRLLAVPESRIAERFQVFDNMLGLVRGRIYYNLISWYRVLALLPGFQLNRHFMEQMMGVSEALPEAMADEIARENQSHALADGFALARSLAVMGWHYLRLPNRRARFFERMAQAVPPTPRDYHTWRADELARAYRELQRQLLRRWDAPLLNDFYAMIAFGTLRALCTRWLGREHALLANDLVSGQGGMVSAEPAQRVQNLANLARPHAPLVAKLASGTLPSAEERANHVAFWTTVDAYLERFGERCMDELKLESPPLREEPAPLLRAIAQLAERPATDSAKPFDARGQAEALVAKTLSHKPLQRWLFGNVLRGARQRIQDRENLRLERTRLFGEVRRLVTALGCRLTEAQHLKNPRDVFFLTIGELLGFVEGTAVTTDLRSLVQLRQDEFAAQASSVPANRFATRGMVYSGNTFVDESSPASRGDDLRGTPCCPGVVRGRARVVQDPRNAEIAAGEILVAQRTDPGWAILFPAAAGLLVEYGSLLSHSAIVARELGLPAIVAVPSLLERVATGDWLEMDGSTGEIIVTETTA